MTTIKVWRDLDEGLWYWNASSEEDGDTEGFLPDLDATATREEVTTAALEAFEEETDTELLESEVSIKIRGLAEDDDDDEGDWPVATANNEEDPDA